MPDIIGDYPVYLFSNYRTFLPNEFHITRFSREYILLIVSKGILRFTEDGKEVEVSAGQWYLQHQNVYQSATKASDCPSYFYIHFTSNSPLYMNITRGECNFENFRYYFDKLTLPVGSTFAEAYLAQSTFLDFLVSFFQSCNIEGFRQERDPIPQVKYLIKEKLTQKTEINLEEISDRLHYNPEYIKKLFKKETGLTISNYIKNLRIAKALDLLQKTNMPICLISQETGYNDVSVFFRNFTKTYGISPSGYRKNLNLK